jgi:DNA-binding MarR family transcriptional regulator
MNERRRASRSLDDSRGGPCSCTALRKASRRVSQLYDAVLEPSGLRTTQRAILDHIARSGIPLAGELAAALVMNRGALTHNLKPLERNALVVVKSDPQDHRRRQIAITAKGRRKLAESEALWLRAQRRFERTFGESNSTALRGALAFISSDRFLRGFAHGGTSRRRLEDRDDGRSSLSSI